MKTIIQITLLLSAALLSACSSLGSHEYSCKGLPAGTKCESTTSIYETTQGAEAPTDESASQSTQKSASASKTKDGKPAIAVQPISEYRDEVIDNFVTPNLPNRPVPIRTPAQVMRIWVNSWEDKSNALIAPGKIYVEVTPRRWVIGKPDNAAQSQGRVFKPLESSGN